MHVGFIQKFLSQFLTDEIGYVILFEVGNLCVSLGSLDACVWDYFWNIQVGVYRQCLSRDFWLASIYRGFNKVRLQLLHCPKNIFSGSW